MADGRIKIAIEVDGKQVEVATKELDKLEDAGHKSGKGVKQTEEGLKGVGNESQKATGKVKKFATALGLVAIGAAAFATLKSSMDGAISRFDTLNKFPRVLQTLGVSAEDSEKAINKLSNGIEGLPTTLNDIAASAQRFYSSFNDIDKATDTALALNNALLGSGSSAEDAKRGTEQYLQALQRGKFEMEEWKTLQETMDIGLIKIAESFGFAGKTAKMDLYNALQEGTITMDQFNDKLIELGTGTGELAKLAKVNSAGIGTSLTNLKNAAVKGIANIIQSLDKLSKEVTGKDLAQNIDGLKNIINAAFKAIGNVIEATAPILKVFAALVGATIDVVELLSPAIIGLATAYVGLRIINKINDIIKTHNALLLTAKASKELLTLATKKQMAAQVAETAAKKADMVATAAQNGLIKTSTMLIGVLTGKMKLSTAAKIAQTAATKALGTALKVMTGPVGWVTAGIGALAGATVAVVKWFNRSSKEAKQLKKETEALGEATEDLNKSIDETAAVYENNQKEMDITAKSTQDLADKIDKLARKENKSAAEKQLLANYIEQLNGSVEDLNLAYDEEADALNMSSKELRARVDLMNEEAKGMAAQQRLLEIDKERNAVNMQLEEINKLREKANELMKNGGKDAKDAKKEIAKLNEQEKELKGTLEDLNGQYIETEKQVKISAENMAKAIAEGNLKQIKSYEELEGKAKEVFDSLKDEYQNLQDTATNAFDKISTESEISMDEMIENLEHNRKAVQKWGENQAKLMEWAAKEGYTNFMKWIDQLGPDHAGELKMMVDNLESSNAEHKAKLEELAKAYESSANAATEAMETKLGEGFGDVLQMVKKFVSDSSKTTKEELKNAGFYQMGKSIPEDMSDGVKATSDTAKKILKNLAKDLLKPFANTKGEFSNIGSNAISGLNTGINSNKNKVFSTVRKIAGSVSSIMRRVLDIHSPSRVTKEIGKFIADGLIMGLESMRNRVEQTSRKVALAATPNIPNVTDGSVFKAPLIRTSTPEQALGTSRMAYASRVNQITNVINNTTTPLIGEPTINLKGDVYIDGYKAGKVLWRPVKENIDRDEEVRKSFRG
jgi:tape measure domain-containing protein